MSTYRFSWHRPSGWTRLGLAGAVGVGFLTPMLWSLGVFGSDDETIKRALIFMFAGLWLFVGVGYTLGWAIRGFMVKLRDHDDEDEVPTHRPAGPHPAQSAPPHRPGGH